jgi:hypothetical protein
MSEQKDERVLVLESVDVVDLTAGMEPFTTLKLSGWGRDPNAPASEARGWYDLEIPEDLYAYLADVFRAAHENAIRRHRERFAAEK